MSPEGLKFRETMLKKRAEKISTLGDLSRALLLPGWQDGSINAKLAKIEEPVRRELARRFVEETRKKLEKGDALNRIAAAVLVGETAAAARGQEVPSPIVKDALNDLVDGLAKAMRDKDEELGEAAGRSLGQIEAPEKIAESMQRLFEEKKAGPTVRRAAAEALANLVRLADAVVVHRHQFQQLPQDQPARVPVYKAIVLAAGGGLNDSDSEVRRSCAEAIRHCSTSLQDLLPQIRPDQVFHPDQPLTAIERKELETQWEEIEKHRREIQPLVKALNDQAPALVKALSDSNPAVCLAAVKGLEGMANVRRHLLHLSASMPPLPEKKASSKLEDALLQELKKAVGDLAKLLESGDKDVRVRLAALYVFEALGKDAVAAVDPLVKALSDKDSFVRWGAVRSLREMAPDHTIVTGLAKCLKDDNADVRRSAAFALQRYGPKAKAAVRALCDATQHDDVATRLSAVQVLAAVGKEARKDAIPSLVKSLTDEKEQKEVRAEAGRALSKFGPHAPDSDAAKALRKALKDPDAQVRLAASEALLR
jgi:HEAT repeat protein